MNAATPAVRPVRTGRRVPVYVGCEGGVPPAAVAPAPARAGTRTGLWTGTSQGGTGGQSRRLQACLDAPSRDASDLPATVPTAPRAVPPEAVTTTPTRAGTRTELWTGAPHDGTGGHNRRLQA